MLLGYPYSISPIVAPGELRDLAPSCLFTWNAPSRWMSANRQATSCSPPKEPCKGFSVFYQQVGEILNLPSYVPVVGLNPSMPESSMGRLIYHVSYGDVGFRSATPRNSHIQRT